MKRRGSSCSFEAVSVVRPLQGPEGFQKFCFSIRKCKYEHSDREAKQSSIDTDAPAVLPREAPRAVTTRSTQCFIDLFTDENMCREKEVPRLYGCNGKGELVKGASGLININVLCISIFSHIFLFVFPLLYFSLHL